MNEILDRILGKIRVKKYPGERPANLGVSRDGKLRSCPGKPNCVNSQASRRRQAIAPLAFSGNAREAMDALKRILADMPRTSLIRRSKDYVHAECASRVFGLTDDVEFSCDSGNKVIHVRSAARMGYWDLGVNRRRVERIRKALYREQV
jgi:uncharacterized protein (DUF1499 family)